MVARPELEARGERGEALDLFGEADGAQGGVGPVALPALRGPPRLAAPPKVLPPRQVQHQRLRGRRGGGPGGVVGAEDVQVVAGVNIDGKVALGKPCVCAIPVNDVSLPMG